MNLGDLELPATPTTELGYILLVFGLFVVPKMLQRARLPSGVTAVLLGTAVGGLSHQFATDATIKLLGILGIVVLFLFAGLEVDFAEFRLEGAVIVQNLAIQVATVLVVAFTFAKITTLGIRPSLLVSLALVTPSTGFILDSLASFGLSERERFWVKAKAISTEIVALLMLFLVLQSESALRMSLSTLALAGIVVIVPVLFRLFAVWIRPYAPKSEFAFVVIVALVCAFATRRLGVYYLAGAFLVGIAARRFRRDLPAMASEKMLHAVEVFASFFVPFYFFSAGLHLTPDDLTLDALLAGILFLALMAPMRSLVVAAHRKVMLKESWRDAFRVSTPLLPTLVFTLVIADILRENFDAPGWLYGGLVAYALTTTLIPGFALRAPIAEPDLLSASNSDEPLNPPPAGPPGAVAVPQ